MIARSDTVTPALFWAPLEAVGAAAELEAVATLLVAASRPVGVLVDVVCATVPAAVRAVVGALVLVEVWLVVVSQAASSAKLAALAPARRNSWRRA
jgi:hypothetical protein